MFKPLTVVCVEYIIAADYKTWDTDHVIAWLKQQGFGKYVDELQEAKKADPDHYRVNVESWLVGDNLHNVDSSDLKDVKDRT